MLVALAVLWLLSGVAVVAAVVRGAVLSRRRRDDTRARVARALLSGDSLPIPECDCEDCDAVVPDRPLTADEVTAWLGVLFALRCLPSYLPPHEWPPVVLPETPSTEES